MTAIEVYRHENTLLFNELYYETEKLTSDLIKFLQPYKKAVLYPDSAEPGCKKEMKNAGFNVYDVNKKQINSGLSLMNSFDLQVTINSTNLIKEFRNYSWIKNKNGEIIDEPIDGFNHGIDAARYVCISTLLKGDTRSKIKVCRL
jgi:phage terminase large subunit